MPNESSKFKFADVIKILGGLGFIIPLVLGYFQYQQSVQKDLDNNFRSVVEKLSSEKVEERVAAASNLGTFLKLDQSYYEEAFEILINTISIELNYNVLNAIRSSLKKIDQTEYKKVVQRLLEIERSFFIYEYPTKKWLINVQNDIIKTEDKFELYKKANFDKQILDIIKEELNSKSKLKYKIQEEHSLLKTHQDFVANFIALFLEVDDPSYMEGLRFYQNSLNSIVLNELNIRKSEFINSALSNATITDTDFSGSLIQNTTFAFSSLSKCNFNNTKVSQSDFIEVRSMKGTNFNGTEFSEVFFLGADLDGANFKAAK